MAHFDYVPSYRSAQQHKPNSFVHWAQINLIVKSVWGNKKTNHAKVFLFPDRFLKWYFSRANKHFLVYVWRTERKKKNITGSSPYVTANSINCSAEFVVFALWRRPRRRRRRRLYNSLFSTFALISIGLNSLLSVFARDISYYLLMRRHHVYFVGCVFVDSFDKVAQTYWLHPERRHRAFSFGLLTPKIRSVKWFFIKNIRILWKIVIIRITTLRWTLFDMVRALCAAWKITVIHNLMKI